MNLSIDKEAKKLNFTLFVFPILYLIGIVILFVSMFVFVYHPFDKSVIFSAASSHVAGSDYTCWYYASKRAWEGKNFYFPMNNHYPGEFMTGFMRFQYPPFLAYFYVPFGLLPYNISVFVYSLFCILLLVLSIFILSKFVKERWWYFAITTVVFLFSPFFLYHLYIGETDMIVVFFVSLCLLAYLKQYYKTAGFVLAISIIFKLMPIIFIPYFFIKNKKVFYTAIIYSVLSCFIFGFDKMTDFLGTIISFGSSGITAGGRSNGFGGVFYNRYTYNLISHSQAIIILLIIILVCLSIFYLLTYKLNKNKIVSDNNLVLLEFGTLMFLIPSFQSTSTVYNGVFYLLIFTAYWNLRPIVSSAKNILIQLLFYVSFSQALLFPLFNERPFVTVFNFRPVYLLIVVILLWYCYIKKITAKT